MFSKFFINRPIFSAVLSIVVIIIGFISIKSLPVQAYPSVVPVQINVQATYPGADAQTLSKTVAAPLEEAINGVDNMIYMTSTASPSGTISISVLFKIGTDPDQANVDVNNRVQLAISKLPQAVRNQGISVRKRSPDMLKVLAFTSKNQKHDTIYISNYVLINVLDDIKRIRGVGDAHIFGNQDYSMRVWLNPDRLANYNLTVTDVVNAIHSQNNQYSAGQLGQEPVAKHPVYTYTIRAQSRLKDVEEFSNIRLKSNSDGSALRLKDVARIELGSESYYFNATYNKEPMIPVGIFLSPGANALEVSAALDKTIAELSKTFPSDIKVSVPYDPTEFVRQSIEEVVLTLGLSILLVVGIIYLFLGNIRATIIPVLAIPVSIIGTFAGFYAAGFSINLLTLFGLTLAIGLVVDDAIVVIENVERILRDNKDISVKEATIKAMSEITGPVVAIVLVLSAVFIPASFMGGFSGKLYQQFAITIVMSVSISGLVALTLTPSLCALFLRHEEPTPFWPIRKFHQMFDYATSSFTNGVKRVIKLGIINLLLFAAMIGAAYMLMLRLPSGLVPGEDQGVIMVIQNMMPGASLERTEAVTNEVSNELLKSKNVTKAAGLSGLDVTTFAYKTDAAISFVHLSDWSKRRSPELSASAIAHQYMGKFSQNKEAFLFAVTPPPIRGMSTTGGFEMYIQDRTGSDLEKLNGYVQKIVQKASERPELMAVRTTLNTNVPQYMIKVDEAKAKALGVTIADIFTTLQATFGYTYVNDFNLFGRTYHVNLQADSQYREGLNSYDNVFVKSNNGSLIPISSIVDIKRIVGSSVIQRFNMFDAAKISGQPKPGYSSGDALKAIEEVSKSILPEGYTISWAGTSYQEKKLQQSGNVAFVYAIVFVFLILAALYESWSIPFAVILAVPFAFFGAVLGLWLRGMESDIYFQVGLITLVGLSAKNAILMVEFAMQRLKQGYPLLEATIEGAKIRFRPIVMTSFAFIMGSLPLALSIGAGANSRHIIGTTVVGGMIALTMIGIYFVPLFYYLIMRFKMKYFNKGEADAH
ncbi:multidrug efflux RND transporter permease subunit [Sulfurimonas sp. HSL-1716]|uniref:efflux RND transporter permease subunit n=1 Tax=Hydrocurvibacter sulfurireducens TaxID=3131937 RepID=UPI0031F73692